MTRILIAAVVAAAGLVGASLWMAEPRLGPAPSLGAAMAQGSEEAAAVEEMTLGDPDAPVTVIEYASFTCPHCARFHETVFEQLEADYIDTGKIHFIYREVYFDRFGLWAGMLARCGGSERYFGFVETLYDSQTEWVQGDDPAAVASNLRRIGRTAGLSDEELNACLSDQAKAEALVAWYEENAEEHGIRSTPSFVIDGETYSNMPYDEFKAILDEALGS